MIKMEFDIKYKYANVTKDITSTAQADQLKYIHKASLELITTTCLNGLNSEVFRNITNFDASHNINLVELDGNIIGYYSHIKTRTIENNEHKLDLYLKNKFAIFNFIPNVVQLYKNRLILIFNDILWRVEC